MYRVLRDFTVYSKNGVKSLSKVENPEKEITIKSGATFYGDFGLSKELFSHLLNKGFIETIK